ncbi:hypothetical protein C8A00DRAFT_37779 [Chaetomidium leptoderma]|uniref:Chromo domain-containing protein n=1 Tax=Chaetomidium leptoderma TaxID=669021 RepID=A0AAN6VDS8_9PEZI|nr:hypothetical protein C8A00DRAFT_37779 [Chaetomidium leptoderma]
MATVRLNNLSNQVSYVLPVVAGIEPASRGLRLREGGPFAPVFGVPLRPPPLQSTHDPPRGSVGDSWDNAISISSDHEYDDDLDDGRSDTSFESLDELLRSKVKSSSASDTDKSVDAVLGDSDAPEFWVTSMAGPGNKSPASPVGLHMGQDRPVPASPGSLASRCAHPCARPSCHQGLGCASRRLRNSKSPKDKAENEGSEGDEPESADVKPRLQPQSPRGAASGCEVDTQQRSSSYRLSQHCDRPDDIDQASGPAQHPSLVPGDRGEQCEDGSAVPSQAQEGRAGIPGLSGDESNNGREVASTELSMQPSASQKQANLQHNIGDEEDYSSIARGDVKQSKDEDVVRLPRGKRRKVNTSTQRRKPPAGRTASKRRPLPPRVAPTAGQAPVQGAKYFQFEYILKWRRRAEGQEYLVKWEGYGHKHNTWEPAEHFDQCPEILEEFHQKAGLSTEVRLG